MFDLFDLGGWAITFWVFWLHRYVRTIVNFISHWTYKSIPIPENPSYTAEDVTVIIPTIHNNFEELKDSIQSILACNPHELLLVTTSDKYQKLVRFVKSLEATNIRTFHVPIANKRIQVCEAIPAVKTSIIIMADDDVTWPHTILPWLLAPFENAKIGGVGPSQRVKRIRSGPLTDICFNWYGAAYIERRNFEISATHGIDGGTSCMSGRTCAFRSEILQNPLFLDGFKTERWGRYQLNADDDNFVTRWLVTNRWKTWIQYNPQCEIETTLENNIKFLYQCSRWARSNWRSNYTSLFTEGHVWRQQPWSTYSLHIATFTSLTFAFDPWIIYCLHKAAYKLPGNGYWYAMCAQVIFMLWIKTIKLVGLFRREPFDLIFLPLSIIFGYFHGFIKIYAGITHRMTSWGSREDGDTNDNERMSPRGRRSESITLPPGNHPGLVRYNNGKMFIYSTDEKEHAYTAIEQAIDPDDEAESMAGSEKFCDEVDSDSN
ncbi:related to polysaccharide synthase Cps1 [Rhynchosporium graminicola]|uniref:Related to polysaccharide synthase Cps1 n=1 Tax=Rhynchosporium graminicola TaxID=2792576 RepID=A0A1E1L072_9HELO|nr:related to polysaccharide synthase Cps1 [Rhynchosporium commune]